LPLGFESRSHGRIAFGFFNIETDLLLLQNLFFFAGDFCSAVAHLARNPDSGGREIAGWRILSREKMGSLHGAISGIDHSGFIGQVYARFPFPRDKAGFKQQPEGAASRPEVERLLERWAAPAGVRIELLGHGRGMAIGPFEFGPKAACGLVVYVWQGGLPRWRDGKGPGYLEEMRRTLADGRTGLFKGLHLD